MVLTTLACVVSATGIFKPAYADVYETLQAKFQSIYGNDAYMDPDSQDGQLLAVFAKAIDDCNALSVLLYNSYSPATSIGEALSNNVKINGIARDIATKSTAQVLLGGTVGTVIHGGLVGDDAGNTWVLPLDVTIPPAGQITVTVVSKDAGAFAAPLGSINRILTPQLGWQTAISTAASSPGAEVEVDAALRRRQTVSTALPSQTVLAGILGAVARLPGVTASRIYENDTNSVDDNTLPPHSIAVVVQGGVAADIATAIVNKKTPGAYTYGSTAVPVTDANGITTTIRFFVPAQIVLKVAITLNALPGYSSTIGDQIKQAVADYVNGQGIGKRVDTGRLYLPAQLYGGQGSSTVDIEDIAMSIFPAVPVDGDIEIAFNAMATLDPANVQLIVS